MIETLDQHGVFTPWATHQRIVLVLVVAPLKLIHEAHGTKESLIAKKYAPAEGWHDLIE